MSAPTPSLAAKHRTLEGPGYRADVLACPDNQRVQLLDYSTDGGSGLPEALAELARERGFGKVFAKIRAEDRAPFEGAGYEIEAIIDGFYRGQDALVAGLFLDEERRAQPSRAEEEEILQKATASEGGRRLEPLPEGFVQRFAGESDAPALAGLYREVFESYPYPVHDPGYLVETMRSHVVYRLVFDPAGQLIAAASGEMDVEEGNSEMTDFATRPTRRGLGLAQRLLQALEGAVRERGVSCLYTIARARSVGMNRVFHAAGYRFTGTLVNNCHISGRFENMHVWCKKAAD
jgi:putative beta-lysine N-acetyltransferase